MVDLDRVIAQMLSGSPAKTLASRAGRKLGARSPRGGGITAIAGVAYTACERHRRGRHVSLAGGPSVAFLPPAADPEARHALGLVLLRSMVAAARAAGKLDDYPSKRILAAVERLDLDADERALLLEELGGPIAIGEITTPERSPEQAAEIYVAALLAIEIDTPAERAWLARLAASLALPGDLLEEIRQRLGDATLEGAADRREHSSRTVRAAAPC